ncbi:MAG: hypothetical protein KJ906_02530 [Nanoarchaeota archaeon]|nr:hypothetical protein [Nanoarchaeota archaeon]
MTVICPTCDKKKHPRCMKNLCYPGGIVCAECRHKIILRRKGLRRYE